jgi:hypothetical protein
MAYKASENWPQIRAEYEQTPASLTAIGARWGVSAMAISKRARADGWQRPTVAQSPTKRTPREILEAIAESSVAPAAARVSACKLLLQLDRAPKPTEEEKHDRVTQRALAIIQGGRK